MLHPGKDELIPVADGVLLAQGASGEASRENAGRIGNVLFVEGTEGVLAWNSGTSPRHAERLIQQLRERTRRPLRVTLVAHPVQEHVFGATRLMADGAELWMPDAAVRLMRQRCETCLQAMKRELGAQQMDDAAVPDVARILELKQGLAQTELSEVLSRRIGRPLQLMNLGHGASPSSLALVVADARVVASGDTVMTRRVNELRDADLGDGRMGPWLLALDRLASVPAVRDAKAIIADHGPPSTALSIGETRAYLEALTLQLRTAMRDGVSLFDLADLPPLKPFSGWRDYAVVHPRNAHQLFLRLERESFDRQ